MSRDTVNIEEVEEEIFLRVNLPTSTTIFDRRHIESEDWEVELYEWI